MAEGDTTTVITTHIHLTSRSPAVIEHHVMDAVCAGILV